MDKKDKKNLAKMCICGHTKGQLLKFLDLDYIMAQEI